MDREYLTASFTGILLKNGNVGLFLEKYLLSPSEQRRGACVAIQYLMRGPEWCKGQDAIKRVSFLAGKYAFSSTELMNMAWEVLRGALKDPEEEPDAAYHVMKYFLKDHLPSGPSFGYCGLFESFNPKEQFEGIDLIVDLCCDDRTADKEAYDKLPAEMQELLHYVKSCNATVDDVINLFNNMMKAGC